MLNGYGVAFFKLSLGMGTMITYGSYFGGGRIYPPQQYAYVRRSMRVHAGGHRDLSGGIYLWLRPEAGPLGVITLPLCLHRSRWVRR